MTLSHYIQQFVNNPTLCNLFQVLAVDTWDRLDYVYKSHYLRGTNEVTITENLLYYTQKYLDYYGKSQIRIEEATNEPVHGNDLLIYIQSSNMHYHAFAVQAKKVYVDERYWAFSGTYSQLHNLIRYAQNIGGIPLYLLYNHATKEPRDFITCGINHDWNQFGCSLSSAFYVQRKFTETYPDGRPKMIIPHFNDFHPDNAIPWMAIVCCDSFVDCPDFKKVVYLPEFPLKEYTLEQLLKPDEWISLNKRKRIKEKVYTLDIGIHKEIEKFAPRFRLIISIKPGEKA